VVPNLVGEERCVARLAFGVGTSAFRALDERPHGLGDLVQVDRV
jgi:hypothetical protein